MTAYSSMAGVPVAAGLREGFNEEQYFYVPGFYSLCIICCVAHLYCSAAIGQCADRLMKYIAPKKLQYMALLHALCFISQHKRLTAI